jgi:hypothetical protein
MHNVMLTLSPRPKETVVQEFKAMFPENRRDPACWDYSAMKAEGITLEVRFPVPRPSLASAPWMQKHHRMLPFPSFCLDWWCIRL